ncbi:MAG TPA: SagB/ThcOx family dehydrogenase [Terriglobia bacterium]|nr:SagB/ThcOx family dehydrogenase [Terriglobia bacterium]
MPSGTGNDSIKTPAKFAETVELPEPVREGRMSVEEAIARRRSVRKFGKEALSAQQVSQLLWAAQGITHREGLRTAPSAGALYPLELYVATPDGFFHYEPQPHRLRRLTNRDLRPAIFRAALEQDAIREAPTVFVFTAVYERTAQKYGEGRTPRYVQMEAGHAAQNLLLEAVALGLGGVPVGAFHDADGQKTLALPREERPLYLIPVGHPR